MGVKGMEAFVPGREVVVWSFAAGGRRGNGQSIGDPARTSADRRSAGPILVVDDDTSILFMVRELLELEGYGVTTAANGEEALARIEEDPPALVLLDMRMPRLDGWGVAAALKQRGISVPVVVVTAAESARRWSEEIGASGYVAKPFDVDDLLDAVERHRHRPGRRPS